MKGFTLKPMGTVNYKDCETEMYKLNGVSIAVSNSNCFVCEEEADSNGKNVLTVSFSNKNREIPQMVIDYVLNFFGIDTNKTYYYNIRETYDPMDDSMLEIHYYEQLQDTEA